MADNELGYKDVLIDLGSKEGENRLENEAYWDMLKGIIEKHPYQV